MKIIQSPNYMLKVAVSIALPVVAVKSVAAADRVNEKPNVIVIFTDDQGYGDLGCYGHPTIKTPNIDRMAAEGMRMTQFYCAAAVSTPSRAALLTGRYPVRTGMYGDKWSVLYPDAPEGLPTTEITMAKIAQDQGYRTACIGKWHLGHSAPYMPNDFGFDYFYGVPYANNFLPLPMLEGYKDKPIKILEDSTDQRYLTQKYTKKVAEFIKSSKNKPFLLYYASSAPHVPLYASENFAGKSLRGAYGDAVEELDWSVGELLKTLKECGIDDNTMVVFTSDNGPWATLKLRGGSSGLLRGSKGSVWEGGFRVPAIFRYPNHIPANTTCYNMCTTMDLFATVVTMCGGELPKDRAIDGVDMSGVLKDPQTVVRNELAYYRGSELRALRKGVWKIHFDPYDEWYVLNGLDSTNRKPILFNLDTDPSETFDMAAKKPEIVDMMLKLRDQYMKRVEIVPSRNDRRPVKQ